MLILATDTSGRNGSIALSDGRDDGTSTDIETVALDPSAFSAQLVPKIAALLSKHGFNKNDVGGFAAVSGPGSFTGLRVGLAAIKALAEVLVKPIAAVSLLEAVAVASGLQGNVVAVLDAGRKLVYAGEYGISSADVFRVSERLLTRDELLDLVRRTNAAGSVVTPDPAVAESLSGTAAAIRIVEMPRADVIARLGWRKILSADFVTPEQLEANYLGRSDAEIFSKPAC